MFAQADGTPRRPSGAAVELTSLQVGQEQHRAEVQEGPDHPSSALALAGQAHNVALEQPPSVREEKGQPLAEQQGIAAVDSVLWWLQASHRTASTAAIPC